MLRGQRVGLRALRLEDVDLLAAWLSDPEIQEYLIPKFPISTMAYERSLRKFATSETDAVLMIENETGAPIGTVGLHNISWRHRQASLAIAVCPPEQRGRGYGCDAVRTLLHHAFHHMGLRRISLYVNDDNEAAIGLYRKCGFRLEGRLRQDRWKCGAWRDTLIMGLLRDDLETLDTAQGPC